MADVEDAGKGAGGTDAAPELPAHLVSLLSKASGLLEMYANYCDKSHIL